MVKQYTQINSDQYRYRLAANGNTYAVLEALFDETPHEVNPYQMEIGYTNETLSLEFETDKLFYGYDFVDGFYLLP